MGLGDYFRPGHSGFTEHFPAWNFNKRTVLCYKTDIKIKCRNIESRIETYVSVTLNFGPTRKSSNKLFSTLKIFPWGQFSIYIFNEVSSRLHIDPNVSWKLNSRHRNRFNCTLNALSTSYDCGM